jgi:rhamnulokinase
MTQTCFLGVDLGAESGRVIAGLFDGRQIRIEQVHRFPNGAVSVGNTLRWDVLRLWSEIQDGLAKAAATYGNRVVSVGVDTWGVDYVLLSRSGEMLGQPYHYRDSRTEGILAQAFSRVPKREIFGQTGLQFMEFNTLFQLLAFQKTNPDLLALADRLLMMPDFFHWCLSGSRVVERTNATTTQCFHPTTGQWAFDLIRKFGLPLDMFPEVVEPGTRLGRLRETIASRTGLSRIEVVAPATHDTGSAVAAVPTKKTDSPDWAYISSGTWSLMGVEVPKAVLTDRALELNVTNEGGIDGTYRLLKNIMGLWLVQECKRAFERAGKNYSYAQLTSLAAEAQPLRSLVNPDARAFLKPDDMAVALREWCAGHGEPVPQSEGELIRCCLESLAFKYRMVLEWLEELTGTRIKTIHVVGGGCQNEALNQLAADACGRPVVAGPVEATGLGNLLVQARSLGELGSLAELREVVRASSAPVTFEPRNPGPWRDAYPRFAALMAKSAQDAAI